MRFKADENLPIEVADLLRQAGHDASTVVEQRMAGEPDPGLAAVCQQEGRAILTFDIGFADIRTYPPEEYPGLLVLRLKRQDKVTVLQVFERILHLLQTESLVGCLWIVDEERVRIRS